MPSERNSCSWHNSTFSPCKQPSWERNWQKVAAWAWIQSKTSHPNSSKISWFQTWMFRYILTDRLSSQMVLWSPRKFWLLRTGIFFFLIHFILSFKVMLVISVRIHNVLVWGLNSQMTFYILFSFIFIAN